MKSRKWVGKLASKEQQEEAFTPAETRTANPKDCPHFIKCNANLCPLDPELDFRNWIPGEDICKRDDFKDLPWIRRQKKVNRTRPDSLEGVALKVDFLTKSAPVPRQLSPEQRETCIERLERYRKAAKMSNGRRQPERCRRLKGNPSEAGPTVR